MTEAIKENDKVIPLFYWNEVTILKYKGDWALVRIAKNGKIAWMKSQYFRAYECYGC
ncbi:MAG: hypothetical protein ACKO7P_03375 [Bacteroidota bacterium]